MDQPQEEKKQEDTQPMKINVRRNFTLLYVVVALLIVAIVVMSLFLFKGKARKPASPQMKQMEETVQQIQKLESDIQEKQNEVFTLVGDYRKTTGKDISGINALNLTPEQKQVFEEKIKSETNVSIQSLLQDILDKSGEIKGMQTKIQELESLLPKPHLVEKGENHYEIAMDFLLNEKGLEKKKTMELIERTALFEPLVPGFKVWNFFSGEEYGTFVTQGSAPISPNQIQRKVKKELVDAKDEAIATKTKLESDIKEMESRRAELISQLDLLHQEKESMLTRISDLNQQNLGLQAEMNSLFYILDLGKNLVKKGILKGGFLRSTKMQSVTAESFTASIDLRSVSTVSITASSLGVSRIKGVTLYPGFYKKGVDYSVAISEDRQTATLTILDPKKLQNERVVIAVE